MIVYDITRRDTLSTEADFWLKDVKANAPTHCIIGLAGNKVDMSGTKEHQCSLDDRIEVSNKNDIKHYKECSAKTDKGVTDIFQKLVTDLDENAETIMAQTEAFTRKTFELGQRDIGKKKKGCPC